MLQIWNLFLVIFSFTCLCNHIYYETVCVPYWSNILKIVKCWWITNLILQATVILYEFHNLMWSLENGGTVGGSFFYLSKAFDIIYHSILFSKGIMVLKRMLWLGQLIDRKQFLTYKIMASSTNPITCGVVQGPILNPLLFMLYKWPANFCNCPLSYSMMIIIYSTVISVTVTIDRKITYPKSASLFDWWLSQRSIFKKVALLTLYHSSAHPYFTFCNQMWGAIYNYNLKNLI